MKQQLSWYNFGTLYIFAFFNNYPSLDVETSDDNCFGYISDPNEACFITDNFLTGNFFLSFSSSM